MISEIVSIRQVTIPQRSSNQTEKKVISLPKRFALHQAAVQIVRQYREHGTEQQLKHGRAPLVSTCASPAFPVPRQPSRLRFRPVPDRQLPGAFSCDLLHRIRYAAQWRAEIRKIDQREQQARDPEQMHMGEERQKSQDGDDLKLQFLRLVRHPFGQRVQTQIEIADRQDGDDQKDTHHDHPDVRFAGRRDEGRQMVGSQRMKLIAHEFLLSRNIASRRGDGS